MSDDIRDAIVALQTGNSNQFKDAIQANLMARAMDSIQMHKITTGQEFFDEPEVELEAETEVEVEPEVEVDDTDPEQEEVSDEEV
tara:strand:- start:655 stop:909 length:255 start_codon:yes stop_codon:yes gene_type:complete